MSIQFPALGFETHDLSNLNRLPITTRPGPTIVRLEAVFGSEVNDYFANCTRATALCSRVDRRCSWVGILILPDWAIIGSSWQQIFQQKKPQCFLTFEAILKTLFQSTCCGDFWDDLFRNFGYFLFQHLVTLILKYLLNRNQMQFKLFL